VTCAKGMPPYRSIMFVLIFCGCLLHWSELLTKLCLMGNCQQTVTVILMSALSPSS